MGKMSLRLPFQGLDHRTAWLRTMLLGASFFGLLTSIPLWRNSRAYPIVPLMPWIPILHPPWDRLLFAAMLLALVLSLWFYRGSAIFFLLASLFAFCEDQNRGQPWLYMYWVMLWLTLLPDGISIAGCRVAISVAYVWAGIQKCNPRFFHVQPGWFVSPAEHWHWPSSAVALLRWAVAATPVIELGIGLALWMPRLRRTAIGAVLAMHLAVLLFLGPLGHNYNLVIWPWNLAMIALVCVLFVDDRFWQNRLAITAALAASKRDVQAHDPKRFRPARSGAAFRKRELAASPGPRLTQAFGDLRRSRPGSAIIALYSLLPILSFFGMWDSDFSFSLYAENQAVANVFVTQAFRDRLPSRMQAYVRRFPQDYDPQHQGPYIFEFQPWCYDELRVPPIPEPRAYRAIYSFLRVYARDRSDLRMIIGPRSGPVFFYEAENCELLAPKR